jgi:protein-S-isoprenylcysteine O-methyltransferase Ste14
VTCSASGQARTRLMPPTYFLIALVLVVASRFLLGSLAYSTSVTVLLGIALMAVGIALNLSTDSAFKKRGTPVSPDATPSAMVASGVFRLTRNPMYLGMALIVAAAALLVGEPIGILAACALVVILDRSFVPGEERNLERVFGSAYADYRATVRRWI